MKSIRVQEGSFLKDEESMGETYVGETNLQEEFSG